MAGIERFKLDAKEIDKKPFFLFSDEEGKSSRGVVFNKTHLSDSNSSGRSLEGVVGEESEQQLKLAA